MGQTYREGETKIRPGVYQRYSNRGASSVAGATDGIVAFIMNAKWGPTGEVVKLKTAKSVEDTYGNCDGAELANRIFEAGANTVYIYRPAGTGGTKGTATITGEGGGSIKLEAKYPGNYPLKAKTQLKAGDATKKQLMILEGTKVKESFTIDVDTPESGTSAEINSISAALEESKYVTVSTKTEGSLAIAETEFAGGTNPTLTNTDYSEGFYALEPYQYNTLCTDTISNDVASLVSEYINTANDSGKQVIGVVGQVTSKDFADRTAEAKTFNNAQMVYVGNGYYVGNTLYDGTKAAAYAAGAIAATPSNQSIVHSIVSKATDVSEKLTNAQYEEAIESGMLLFSLGPNNEVWFDSGINTLIRPADNQDDGWKKLKRVKVRIELMDRIDKTIAVKIGKVNCNADGIADVLQGGNGVLGAMIDENKLAEGATMYQDVNNPATSDSAWFIIEADDVDSLEKIYLHYQFRYSQNS